MNEHLRDRVLRKLETLSDERGYQVLDYIEFLESKYAERQAPPGSIFTRFSEAVEDRLRAGKVSASAIAETMSLMSRAMNVLNGVATGVAAAGRSVASDFERATASRTATPPATGSAAANAGTSGGAPAPGGAPVAGNAAARTASEAGTEAQPGEPASSAHGAEPNATESGELDPPVGR